MDSKHTDDSKNKEQAIHDWMPDGWKGKKESSAGDISDTNEEVENETREANAHQATLAAAKRTGSKQRKESLEQYRETFLQIPKLVDRKPVFVSLETRDKLDEIVRRLGGRKMSVSGFIENLARHHFELYGKDIENWKKL
ncbi:MAG: DUF3408 domain-containing protein [Draconibacterium sp.]